MKIRVIPRSQTRVAGHPLSTFSIIHTGIRHEYAMTPRKSRKEENSNLGSDATSRRRRSWGSRQELKMRNIATAPILGTGRRSAGQLGVLSPGRGCSLIFFPRRSAGSAGVETHAPGAKVCDAGGVSEFALGYTCRWRLELQEFPGVLGGYGSN